MPTTTERIHTARSAAERVEREAAMAGAVLETAESVIESIEDVVEVAAEVERKARRWMPKILILVGLGTVAYVVVRRLRKRREEERREEAARAQGT